MIVEQQVTSFNEKRDSKNSILPYLEKEEIEEKLKQGKVGFGAIYNSEQVSIEKAIMLLGLNNVEVKKSHILIKGTRADYSIHLGSGVVHKVPGGYLSLFAVHSSHRGRVFLPFADNDPKTAEVLSKMILLGEDDKIMDPTVLRQI